MNDNFPEKGQVLFKANTDELFIVSGKQDIDSESHFTLTSHQSSEVVVVSAQNLNTQFTESPSKDDFSISVYSKIWRWMSGETYIYKRVISSL